METIDQYADLMNPLPGNQSDYSDLAQPISQIKQYSLNDIANKFGMPTTSAISDFYHSMMQKGQPLSPIKENVENLVSSFIAPEAAISTLRPVGQGIAKGYQYIQPNKTVNKFMEKISGVEKPGLPLKTAEENVTDLAKRISFARNSAANEALAHKEPVFKSLGEKTIIEPSDLYITGRKNEGDYLTHANPENYPSDLKDIHKQYKMNPTLNNADQLQQQIGSRIGKLRRDAYIGKGDKSSENELGELVKSRDNLLRDQDKFMQSQDPYNKAQYDLFRSKWRNNVTPYDDSPILSEIVRKGTQDGITPSEIKSVFAYPSAQVKKIAQDIGPSGRNNILYNELQSESKLKPLDLVDALKSAKQFGFQQYIDPQMEMLAQRLPSQYKTAEALKTIGKGTAGGVVGGILGHPVLGAMVAAGYKPAKDITKKALETLKK